MVPDASNFTQISVPTNRPCPDPRLRIVTWNVNALADHQGRRLTAILNRLLKLTPVPYAILLQELFKPPSSPSAPIPGQPIPSPNPASCLLGRVYRINFESRCGRDALCAEVLVPSQSSANYHHFQLVNVHLDIQPSSEHAKWTLLRRCHQLWVAAGVLHHSRHGLVAGDFNVSHPEDEKTIEDMGLSDAWKYLHGDDDPGYTWCIEGNTAFRPERRDRIATLGLKVLDMRIIHPEKIDEKTAAEKTADDDNPDDNERVPWSDHSGLECTFMVTDEDPPSPEMEHLPLPRDPIAGHPDIPLGTHQHHDPEPFDSYPDRHAARVLAARHPHVPTQVDALNGTAAPGAAGIASFQVLDYLQGYLFFSLLGEFLGRADEDGGVGGGEGRFDPRAYMTARWGDDGKPTFIGLSTKRLHDDLKALRAGGWLARVRRGDERHTHIDECLAAAQRTLAGAGDTFPGLMEAYADEMVCLASVGETLDQALQTALSQGPVDDINPEKLVVHEPAKYDWLPAITPLLDPTSGPTKASMVAAGWCPGDISRLCNSFHSVAALYYFTNFKAAPDPMAANMHAKCRDHGCDLRIPADPHHMSPPGEECGCPGTLSFEEEDIVAIYEKGEVPCFSVGKLEDGSLAVALASVALDEESRRDPRSHYVALSHVWSEGMGNPAGNALPFCQVGYVQYWSRMAYQLAEEKMRDGGEGGPEQEELGGGVTMLKNARDVQVFLWIDTLCCPATPGRGKDLCLSRMRAIYSNASAVLVKSSVLSEQSVADIARDTEGGVMDVAARIYLSPWMRRMWTLQEGVLAGASHKVNGTGDRLCFSFRDGLLTLDSVVGLLKRAPAREARLAFRMMAEFRDLSPRMWRFAEEGRAEDPKARELFLPMLVNALKYRGLTVPSDEPICLATLLDLRINASRGPVAPLIGDGGREVAHSDDAMCELWRRVEEILKKGGGAGLPSDIIFSQVPRVRIAGFRWAPRTLVQYARHGNLYTTHSSKHPASITEDGFRVWLPGANIACAGDPGAAARIARLLGPTGDESADNDTDAGEGRPEGDEKAASVARVIIVNMGDRWYAVRVHGGSGEGAETDASPRSESDGRLEGASGYPQRGGDLSGLIGSGSVALIFRPDEEVRGPGLLVSAMDSASSSPSSSSHLDSALEGLNLDAAGPRQVRSELPVMIMPVAGPSCTIFGAAQKCIDDSRRAEAAETKQAVNGEEAEDQKSERALLVATAEGLVGSSSELKEALYLNVLSRKSSATDGDALDMFLDFVRQVARCGGVWSGERYPDDVEWCVD
ncbi:HET domain-containing protein [Colletotrichum sojae]|uniref:HET domain-containing protein n=1 Tax=Colletotrichum sojae TaxID=2175907 RepID=A0A8H6MM82_9PEZI|nr:HET domain-containing protein [Colletotrichum sojae]